MTTRTERVTELAAALALSGKFDSPVDVALFLRDLGRVERRLGALAVAYSNALPVNEAERARLRAKAHALLAAHGLDAGALVGGDVRGPQVKFRLPNYSNCFAAGLTAYPS